MIKVLLPPPFSKARSADPKESGLPLERGRPPQGRPGFPGLRPLLWAETGWLRGADSPRATRQLPSLTVKRWSPTLPTEKQWSPGFTAPVSTWCRFMSAPQSSNWRRVRLMPGVSGRFPPSFLHGRRPFCSDRRQKPEPLSCGPQLIPSPGLWGPEGAGQRAGGAPRSAAHLSQSTRAQVRLRVEPAAATPGRLTGQEGHAVHNTSLRCGVAGPDRAQMSQAAHDRPPHRTWPLQAPVPATLNGLGDSLRVARSLWPKYREILGAKRTTAVKDSLFYQGWQNSKRKTPLQGRCWPIPSSSPPKAPPTAEDWPMS